MHLICLHTWKWTSSVHDLNIINSNVSSVASSSDTFKDYLQGNNVQYKVISCKETSHLHESLNGNA